MTGPEVPGTPMMAGSAGGDLAAASADRHAPLGMAPAQFRALGHALVDRIAALMGDAHRPAHTHEDATPPLPPARGLPADGEDAAQALADAAALLLQPTMRGGDPRFHGYIRPAPAPIGVLAELLVAAGNHNLSLRHVSPAACAIEDQTVAWLAELVGYPAGCGGQLHSGGTLANLSALLVARRAVLADAPQGSTKPLAVYASRAVHGWLTKAVDAAGLPRHAIRWVPSTADERLDADALDRVLADDSASGWQPLLVVGTAGTVATGAVDPLPAIAAVCRRHGVWFHVDGAYGAPAACLIGADAANSHVPGLAAELDALRGMALADSLALDPHKWLSAPLGAGCLLVREPQRLLDAFAAQPSYYASPLDGGGHRALPDPHQISLENSRGLRALKVWLALRMAGRSGYQRMLADDIALAQRLFERAHATPGLEAGSRRLSITTFRCRPAGVDDEAQLNLLNRAVIGRLQASGRAFVSPAIVEGRLWLRACLINFRTQAADVDALPALALAAAAAAA